MSDTELPRHAALLLNHTRRLQALTMASLQVARDRLEELKAMQEDEEPQIVDVKGRIDRTERWITRAYQHLMWIDEQSHEVGVLVQKVEMGIVDPTAEPVRKLSQLMAERHQEVAVQALDHLGRGQYRRALSVGADLLVDTTSDANEERLETTDQFEELMQQVNDEPVAAADDAVSEAAEDLSETESSDRMNDPTVTQTQ